MEETSASKPHERDPGPSLYSGHRVLAMFPVYNEEGKVGALADRCVSGLVDQFIAVDDGSTDRGPEILRGKGIEVLEQDHLGLGAAIKHAVRYGREQGFSILVVLAGNGKDDPREIPALLRPIVEEGCDCVQGSRFLPGGARPNTPLFRLVAIRLLSAIYSLYMRKRCTDLTNGFRAYRLSILDDPRILIDQEWLDNYEYEYYVHWMAYKLGYRVTEVAVTKAYPEKGVEYSKVKPITGWWRMLRPFVLLGLGIKR